MKKEIRQKKSVPIENLRSELQDFIRFLRETGENSLKVDIPEREALQRAVQRLTNQHNQRTSVTDSLIGILDSCEMPEHTRDVALQNLWSALASAFIIGENTRSRNTMSVGTAAGRSKAAQTREPADRQMREAISKHEKIGKRGLTKRVAKELGVNPKTVSRHRKKMRTR
jgi:hypothetical protein